MPIDMSSHPTPRVGLAVVGLRFLVHFSRLSDGQDAIGGEVGRGRWVAPAARTSCACQNWREILAQRFKLEI